MIWRTALRSAFIALLTGWTVALLFGGILAFLQRDAIFTAFSGAAPDKINLEIQTRLTRDLTGSSLLLFVQIGVASGVLAWQVGKTAKLLGDLGQARQYGVIAGAIVALVQAIIAMFLQAPWIFTIPMIALLVGAG